MQPLISVIVPIYKVELYLRQCVDSILAQTYQNLEIILVDDGSPDQCGALCDVYARQDPRVRVLHKQNGGLSDARNAGIDIATGEYIGFVDSDDWIMPDMYECLYQAAEKYHAEIVVCEYYECWSNRYYARHGSENQIFRDEEGIRALLDLKFGNYAWNKLYKRELWTPDIRYPVGKIYEDARTTYKIVQKCTIIVAIPEIKYFYRRNMQGITMARKVENKIESVSSHIERFEAIGDKYLEQWPLMLKVIYENSMQLCDVIGEKHKSTLSGHSQELNVISKFLRRYKDEVFAACNCGRLGRLSYHFLCQGTISGFCVSAKLGKLYELKKKLFGKKIENVRRRIQAIKSAGKKSYYYKWCLRLPIRKTVFMESRGGEDFAGNIFKIAQAACKRNIKVYLSVEEAYLEKVNKILKTGSFPGLEIVIKNSRKYYKVLGTSQYLFTDTCLDYDAIKRADQIHVNTWHGTPLKMLEYDVKNQRHDMGGGAREHLKSDYLAVPSRFLFETLLKASNTKPLFNGKAVYCGYPRNSIFFNKGERKRIRAEKKLDGKEVFAYMPTWRDAISGPVYQEYSIKKILDFFDERLGNHQIVLVNLHNYTKEQIDYKKYKKVFPFPGDIDTYTVLNAADCLITDYSSVLFDYANTRKKVVLFTYDCEEYLKNRGMYFGLEDMPFPKAYTYEELARELNIKKTYDDTEFVERFCTYDCAEAADKLLSVVIDGQLACKTEGVVQDGKKNILIYDAHFMMREIDDGPARQVLETLDLEKANYFYCYRQELLRKTPAYLQNFPEGIRILTVTYNTACTFMEKLSAKLSGGGNVKVPAKREMRRQFCGKRFDEIWILDDNEYDPFCKVLKEIGKVRKV